MKHNSKARISVWTVILFAALLLIPNPCYARGRLRILVTGFDAFGGYESNPSKELVEYINSESFEGMDQVVLKGITLPVTYYSSWVILQKAIVSFSPDYILSLGFYPGSDRLRIESTARNRDGGYTDNEGISHKGEIVKNAPFVNSSELPVQAIKEAVERRGIPASISVDAGGYICNHIFYQETRYTLGRPDIRSGFFHIPDWPVQGDKGLWNMLKEIIGLLQSRSIKAGVFQFEPLKNQVPQNIDRIKEIVSETLENGIDFYVFPEMAVSGLVYGSANELLAEKMDKALRKAEKILQEIARENHLYLSIGTATREGAKLFNSYLIFQPDGRVYTYHKNHLYGSDVNWSESGQGYVVLDAAAARIGALICHDVTYPESFQTYLQKNAGLLIVGTNWIGSTPITRYLKPYSNDFSAIFISDRKGSEQGYHFPGNTCVMAKGRIFKPSKLSSDGMFGIIYLFINDL